MYTGNMKEFKTPDLTAPRFRPKKQNLLNKNFHKKLVDKNPKLKDVTLDQVKDVVKLFNGKIWKSVIEHRDGIDLPESLGKIFIGSVKKKGGAVDYKKSKELGYTVTHRNWESDDNLAKIFYTTFESKYKFNFHQLWGFTGVRDFKRDLASTYQSDWKKYISVAPDQKVSRLFRKQIYKDKLQKEIILKLEDYNEFDFS